MANSIEPFPIKSNVSIKVRPSIRPTPPSNRLKNSRRQKRSLLFQGMLWGTTFGLTALLSAIAGIGVAFFTPLGNPIALTQTTKLPGSSLGMLTQGENWNSLFPYNLSRPVNILVMGVDRVLDAPPDSLEAFESRSDTMLLLRFDPTDNTFKLLSIPRDTRVEIPGRGYRKINDANVIGGPALAAEVVSNTLSEVKIDRYVRVTTNAFRELVDLVGGVEVYVPKPMVYQDVTQKLDINLQAGLQILNGDQSEQFARFRKDENGDIGRVQRQEILLKSLQKRLNNPTIIPRIPGAINILQKSVDTNLSMEEILALANFGRQLEKKQVQMVMLPGRFSQPDEFDGRSYWIMANRGRDRVMAQYFDVQLAGEVQPDASTTHRSLQRLTIALQNATEDPTVIEKVQTYLRQQNFRNVYVSKDSDQLLGETEIVAQKGDLKSAKELKTFLGLGQVEASSTGDLASDITLRIGLDAMPIIESKLSDPVNVVQP
ncbi:MAG: LCP family protein [Microcystaceae cyanobacterium]